MGYAMVAGGKPDMAAPVTDILASDIAVGSVVKLMENGMATEYLVVNQGKPSGSSLYDDSCDGMWLLRKDIYELRPWHNASGNNYANSTIKSYLNGTFINLFDKIASDTIKQVKIPYVNGNGNTGSVASGENGLSCKIFLLSGCEVGFVKSNAWYLPADGAILSYFSETNNSKRIAKMDGSPKMWWLRSPSTDDNTYVMLVSDNGSFGRSGFTSDFVGVRPALILPSNALFDKNTLILKGVA